MDYYSNTYPNSIKEEVAKITPLFTECINKEIEKAIEKINSRVSQRICDDFRKEVLQKERQALFSDSQYWKAEKNEKLPDLPGVEYLPDEFPLGVFDDGYDDKFFVSNYGRVIEIQENNEYEESHPAGARLTDELIDYIYDIYNWFKYSDGRSLADFLIRTYNLRWAYAVNKVHDRKVKEIEEEISKRYETKFKLEQIKNLKLESTIKDLMVWKDHYERSVQSLNNRIDALCDLINTTPAEPEKRIKQLNPGEVEKTRLLDLIEKIREEIAIKEKEVEELTKTLPEKPKQTSSDIDWDNITSDSAYSRQYSKYYDHKRRIEKITDLIDKKKKQIEIWTEKIENIEPSHHPLDKIKKIVGLIAIKEKRIETLNYYVENFETIPVKPEVPDLDDIEWPTSTLTEEEKIMFQTELMVKIERIQNETSKLKEELGELCKSIRNPKNKERLAIILAKGEPEKQAKATIEQVKNCKDITPTKPEIPDDIDWESMRN